MRVIIIGASGDVGRAAFDALNPHHDIITAGRSSGDIRVDISEQNSIKEMYEKTGKVDAVISTVGNVHFSPLSEYTQDTFMVGLQNKVMGQINLVLQGLDYVTDKGSFTLTSGVLDRDPIKMGVSSATANGGTCRFRKKCCD